MVMQARDQTTCAGVAAAATTTTASQSFTVIVLPASPFPARTPVAIRGIFVASSCGSPGPSIKASQGAVSDRWNSKLHRPDGYGDLRGLAVIHELKRPARGVERPATRL